MKTSLITASLALAVGLPATILAGFVGLNLPAVLDASHVFSAFAGSIILMIAISDYSRSTKSTANVTTVPAANIAQFPRPASPSRLAA